MAVRKTGQLIMACQITVSLLRFDPGRDILADGLVFDDITFTVEQGAIAPMLPAGVTIGQCMNWQSSSGRAVPGSGAPA